MDGGSWIDKRGRGDDGRRVEMVWGDYLLTEEDWMEEEFAAAQAEYWGAGRGTIVERERMGESKYFYSVGFVESRGAVGSYCCLVGDFVGRRGMSMFP